MAYGHPLSVAAFLHCLPVFFLDESSDAIPSRVRIVGLLPCLMSDARYSAGTTSNRRSVDVVRGSGGALGSVEKLRVRDGEVADTSAQEEGNDLNSTCRATSET